MSTPVRKVRGTTGPTEEKIPFADLPGSRYKFYLEKRESREIDFLVEGGGTYRIQVAIESTWDPCRSSDIGRIAMSELHHGEDIRSKNVYTNASVLEPIINDYAPSASLNQTLSLFKDQLLEGISRAPALETSEILMFLDAVRKIEKELENNERINASSMRENKTQEVVEALGAAHKVNGYTLIQKETRILIRWYLFGEITYEDRVYISRLQPRLEEASLLTQDRTRIIDAPLEVTGLDHIAKVINTAMRASPPISSRTDS